MCIGAHPDDCEEMAGGVAVLCREAGGRVSFVAATNGDAGHYDLGGEPLALRRRIEAETAARRIGAAVVVLNHHDGQLVASLDLRWELLRLIRAFRPDVVVTHRPYDYHPDHRNISLAVQDCAYLLTVPMVLPNAPVLDRDPVILYASDEFLRPYPFHVDVVVDIGSVVDAKLDMLACHTSQFFEWLPAHASRLIEVPEDPPARRAWLRDEHEPSYRQIADRFRDQLVARYGAERGTGVLYAEAFELCEFGAPLTALSEAAMLPF
jgi:LmbE family N-acetylglucosaminyl deacetylase